MAETLKAILLGILQGIAEFLPISSSGHIEIGQALLSVDIGDYDLAFSIAVHLGTVLSTIVVFWDEIIGRVKGVLKGSTIDIQYATLIIISMLPVLFVGIFLKDQVEAIFNGNLLLVGAMLCVTAILLLVTIKTSPYNGNLSYVGAFIMGIAQAFAVLPGISRSGATISTGLVLGTDRKKVASFSFLMAIPPILGASILEINDLVQLDAVDAVPWGILLAGGLSAFLVGVIACRIMVQLVLRNKLVYFAAYCAIVGIATILWQIL